MVRKRLWPPSSSFWSECRSSFTSPVGTKAENDLTATSSVSIALDSTAISRIAEFTGGNCSPPRSWMRPTLKASLSSGPEMMPVRKKMVTISSSSASNPKPATRRLFMWKEPVKSFIGVTMKSCQLLPNSGARVDRLAT